MTTSPAALRPGPDDALVAIADYATHFVPASPLAFDTARACLMDRLACGFLALKHPACTKLLGPVVRGATMNGGSRVPGTSYELDPVKAAFDIGTMVRWLDCDDTWVAPDYGHPSDNLGGLLAVADWRSRRSVAEGATPLTVRDLLAAMIKAHEIHGVTAMQNAFDRVGFDHVINVRLATTAVVTAMLGGTRDQVVDAVSNAFLDGGALRAYRHARDTGTRERWAAGDATSRGVRLALMTLQGEPGYPSALTESQRGPEHVLLKKPLAFDRPFGTQVMESVLFTIPAAAEVHGQEALQCAMRLHEGVAPLLQAKFAAAVTAHFPAKRAPALVALFAEPARLDAMPVHEFVSATVTNAG